MGGRKQRLTQLDEARREGFSTAHSFRFRAFATGYPRMVALAYDGDIFAAMRRRDKQVARRVVAWAKREGWPPRDYALAVRIARGKGR